MSPNSLHRMFLTFADYGSVPVSQSVELGAKSEKTVPLSCHTPVSNDHDKRILAAPNEITR